MDQISAAAAAGDEDLVARLSARANLEDVESWAWVKAIESTDGAMQVRPPRAPLPGHQPARGLQHRSHLDRQGRRMSDTWTPARIAAFKAEVHAKYKRQQALIPDGWRRVDDMEWFGYSDALLDRLATADDLRMSEPGFWIRREKSDI